MLELSQNPTHTHMHKQSIIHSQLGFYGHILVQVHFQGEGVDE